MSQKQRFEQKLTHLIRERTPQWLNQDAYPVPLVVLTWVEVSRCLSCLATHRRRIQKAVSPDFGASAQPVK